MRLLKVRMATSIDPTGILNDGISAARYEDFAEEHAAEFASLPELREALAPDSMFGRTPEERDFAAFFQILPLTETPGMAPGIARLAGIKGRIVHEVLARQRDLREDGPFGGLTAGPDLGAHAAHNQRDALIGELQQEFAGMYEASRGEAQAWMQQHAAPAPVAAPQGPAGGVTGAPRP